jgi:hypothetical protein
MRGVKFLNGKDKYNIKTFFVCSKAYSLQIFWTNCKLWKTHGFNEVTVQCPGQVFCAARLTQPTAPAGSLSPRQPRPPRGVLQVNMAGSAIYQRKLSRRLLQVNMARSAIDQRKLSRRLLQVQYNTNTNNLFPPLSMRYNEMHNMISILIKIGTI